jgi:hypothetical protein
MDERHTKNVSLLRTRIGPLIGALGGALMVIGLFVPLVSISLPSTFYLHETDPSAYDPYPPMVNAWQTMSSHWNYSSSPLTTVAPVVLLWVLLAVVMLSASLLALFQADSLLVARVRPLAASVSIVVLCVFWLFASFMNFSMFAGVTINTTPVFLFLNEPGFWLLLAGAVVSVIGVGKVSIGAILGAFCGVLIAPILLDIAPSMLDRLPQGTLLRALLEYLLQGEIATFLIYISFTFLGSILGGWLFLRRQARLYRARTTIHPRE